MNSKSPYEVCGQESGIDFSYMEVNIDIRNRCRVEIDTGIKKLIRYFCIPFFKWRYGFFHLGEGFQWGRAWKITLAKGSFVGRYVYIGANFESAGKVFIGDLAMVSTECKIVGDDHVFNVLGSPTRLVFSTVRDVTVIEADVWIGKRVTIKEGVRIGRGAVIGTGTIVTRDIPPYSIVVGVPGRVVGKRFSERDVIDHEKLIFG